MQEAFVEAEAFDDVESVGVLGGALEEDEEAALGAGEFDGALEDDFVELFFVVGLGEQLAQLRHALEPALFAGCEAHGGGLAGV